MTATAETRIDQDIFLDLLQVEQRLDTVEAQLRRVSSGDLATGSVTGTVIAAGTIDGTHIAPSSITTTHIAVNSITTNHIVAGTILASDISANTITAAQIAASTITTNEIAANTITASDIASATITATQIASATITGALIAASTITATNIATATITGTLIAGATITGSNIAAATITATNISVSQLSAITADLGNITAGTITGGTIRSAASGQRWQGDTTGLKLFNAAGEIVFHADTATGRIVALRGIGGINELANARFVYWPSGDSPWNWQHYDNGGNTGAVWSKVAGGGPNGENAWRLVVTTVSTNVGFQSTLTYPFKNGRWYVLSFWWKGNKQPTYASNGDHTTPEWIENPTASTTIWKRYALRRQYTADRADWTYIQPINGSGGDFQIANVQLEEGELLTSFGTKPEEILPDQVTVVELQDGIFNSQATVNSFFSSAVIHADRLVAASITATQIQAATITSVQIVAATITGGNIAAGTITAANIQAGTITADRMNVTSLSAITANLGTITAGTITGALIQTATSGARVALDTTVGLRAFDASAETFRINASDGTVTQRGYQPAAISGTTIFTDADTYNFEADLGNWVTSVGNAPVRDTTQFHSGVASMKLTATSADQEEGPKAATNGTYTFLTGHTYRISMWYRPSVTTSSKGIALRFGHTASGDYAYYQTWQFIANTWQQISVNWSPTTNRTTGVELYALISMVPDADVVYFDDLTIFDISPPASAQIAFRATVPSGSLMGAVDVTRWNGNSIMRLAADAATLVERSESRAEVSSAGVVLASVISRYDPSNASGKASANVLLTSDTGVGQKEYKLIASDGTSDFLMIGEVRARAQKSGVAVPRGWLLCNGQAVSRTTYANLFNVIGTTYGVGNGTTTFNIPDFRGRVMVGRDAGAGRLTTNNLLGSSGGAESHTLTIAEMPSHNHGNATGSTDATGGVDVAYVGGGANNTAFGASFNLTFIDVTHWHSIPSQGGGGAHDNMPPYQVIECYIYTGT